MKHYAIKVIILKCVVKTVIQTAYLNSTDNRLFFDNSVYCLLHWYKDTIILQLVKCT